MPELQKRFFSEQILLVMDRRNRPQIEYFTLKIGVFQVSLYVVIEIMYKNRLLYSRNLYQNHELDTYSRFPSRFFQDSASLAQLGSGNFEALFYDNGCDDALVSFQNGHIIIDFAREKDRN